MAGVKAPLPITDAFVNAFAEFAARAGWSQHSLLIFAQTTGASGLGLPSLRWIARRLNEIADSRMRESFCDLDALTLERLILARFEQNASLKPAGASLARSDVLHPFDTLGRTAATADLMLELCGDNRMPKLGRRWRLVFAYSLCVLVWLFAGQAKHPPAARSVRRSLALFGLR